MSGKKGYSQMGMPLVRRERLCTSDIAANDQRLDGVGALIGEDSLNISMVAGNVVFEQNTVATEHLAGIGYHLASETCIVHLCQGSHRRCHFAFLLQLTQAQTKQLHAGHVS